MGLKFDILVVGSGPAGATAATLLSRKGYSVGMIDKNAFPRPKPCAGAIILDIFEELPYLKQYQDRLLESVSYQGVFVAPDGKTQISLPIRLGACLREKFDTLLVEEAIHNQVKFISNEKVIHLKRKNGKILVQTKTKIFESQVVVGADGANSTIAKKAFVQMPLKRQRNYFCRVYDFYYDEEKIIDLYEPERPFHVFAKLAGCAQTGYGWLFPKKRHICVGFGITPTTRSSRHKSSQILFYSFLKFLFSKALLPKNLASKPVLKSAMRSKSAFCPVGGMREKVYEDRVLLVGDAGGFVDPATGMGILDAVISAKIASKVIINSFQDNNPAFLSNYDILCKKRFQRPYQKALTVQKLFLSPLTTAIFRIAKKWFNLSKG
ncbi:MAG: NAD(P)/FAD-dependent oxidoreductase [Candidatus Hodarchaeota archaeon]